MGKNLPSLFNARKWSLAIATFTLMLLSAAVSAQPVLLKDLSGKNHSFVSADGQLYFAQGDSLFTGNAGSVSFVKELNEPIRYISPITIGTKVFILTTTAEGFGLWVSTGTAASTLRVASFR